MYQYEPLTDEQWLAIEHLFPKIEKRGRGKPHTPWRKVINSIFHVLLMKVKWGSVPMSSEFATKSASHRWFVLWEKNGFLNTLLDAYQKATQEGVEVRKPPRRQRLSKSAYQKMTFVMDEVPSEEEKTADLAIAIPSHPERREISSY